jgi:hypothetical protein
VTLKSLYNGMVAFAMLYGLQTSAYTQNRCLSSKHPPILCRASWGRLDQLAMDAVIIQVDKLIRPDVKLLMC